MNLSAQDIFLLNMLSSRHLTMTEIVEEATSSGFFENGTALAKMEEAALVEFMPSPNHWRITKAGLAIIQKRKDRYIDAALF